MSGPTELAIAAGILADCALKSTGIVAIGWGVTRTWPWGSAAQRHSVWAATFLALPLLPLLASQRGPELAIDAPWLVAIWALGCCVSIGSMIVALLRLSSLRRKAIPDPHHPQLLHSDDVDGPVTWGVFRPIILLPTAAAHWPSSHRSAALAHEQAHVARRDWWVHMGAWFVTSLFWFHPGVWMARRALMQEAEHAADDRVLAEGVRPSDYASLLLSLARPAPGAALAVGSSFVGRRVQAVLDQRRRSPLRWPTAGLALMLTTSVASAIGGWSMWSAPEQALTCQPGPLP